MNKQHNIAKATWIALGTVIALTGVATAQNELTARDIDPGLDSNYFPVNLDGLANDAGSIAAPSERVQVKISQRPITIVPFLIAKGAGGNNLFLKPIGWAGENADAGTEYPSYIARYDNRPQPGDRTRAMVKVPVTDYQYIWMLAAADNDAGLSNVVTFRVGIANGPARLVFHDLAVTVPRADETKDFPNVLKTFSQSGGGKIYLLHIPFGQAIAQDFRDERALDFDITKELHVVVNQPDANRFEIRPVGPPSGVHIYALTLQKSPFELEVGSTETGNVFNQPEPPTFHLNFIRTDADGGGKFSIETVARRDDGAVTTTQHPDLDFIVYRDYANPNRRVDITIPVRERGHYELDVNVHQGNELVAHRHTTFAILAPDTRKYRQEGPLGTWDFGGVHYTPNDPDLLGPLYVKAGLHYGMMVSLLPKWGRDKYGIAYGLDERIRNLDEMKALIAAHAKDANSDLPTRFLTFHENAISGPHITRTPDLFTGKQYQFDKDEEKQFQAMWKEAEDSFHAVRAYFPDADIYFGNGAPHVLEEFLRHKFPRNELDKIGNESGVFMRLPETQPTDFVANNAGLWMMREIADHYGYKDLPLRQCYEMCYPCSNPGNLSEETQAAYFIRNIMHSLAWRIPIIRPGSITDMGNSYYFSNWGASGFCHAYPSVTPKQAYVAIATLTQAIDGAQFTREVPSGSPVVYAMEFKKKDGGYVTCLWTIRGKRALALKLSGREASLIDMMGRESAIEMKTGWATIEISSDPCYLVSRRPIDGIAAGQTIQEGRPAAGFVISALDNLADWTVEADRDNTLEIYDFLTPRRKGNFSFRNVPVREGEINPLEVKPNLPAPGSSYLQMYSALDFNKDIAIPGQPTEIGLMVDGNGGFGRIVFELEDAAGQRWTSIGAEQSGKPYLWMADWLKPDEFAKLKTSGIADWNSDDVWGRSSINFEGWRFLKLQMPGNYPFENHNWPRNSQWRCVKADGGAGDGVVKYPLKFKRLIVTLPEKVLHGTRYAPVPRPEIYLKDLTVTFAPLEQVFANE